MPIVTLRDLYIAELQDLFDAEGQIVSALPAMAKAATSTELREALTHHLEQTQVQLQRLELLLRQLNVRDSGQPCEAVRGLIAEGRRRIAETERGDVLDAAIIGAAQRIEHYEIAAYGCARTYASTLGDGQAARLLQQTLEEEGDADHRLSRIAERGINQSAGEDAAIDTGRQRTRLHYVPVGDLREFRYREFRIRNAQHEDLGSLDGLIIETEGRRPVYFVVDSGGWFVGRRFLVPVGLLQADEASKTLRTELDRDAIRRYPPFEPGAFAGTRAESFDETAPAYTPPTWLMTGVWMTEASGFAAVPPRANAGASPAPQPASSATYPENELMTSPGEAEERADAATRDAEPRIERYPERSRGEIMAKERERNEDARGGDVIVQDSIASGKPQLPTDRDPIGRETNVAVTADELGESKDESD
jgi:ferritin-like metal-binding protein YciE